MRAFGSTGERAPGIATALGVFAGYFALVLALTWPLGAHLATHLPDTVPGCRFDPLVGAWMLAHLSRNLAHPCWSCLVDANIYHPTPGALFYGPTALGALPYFAPPFLLTRNPALALNLTLLVGVAATATTTHLVVGRWTRSGAAAFVGASAFLTTRWVLWDWLPPTPWFAALACFPLVIVLATRTRVSWPLAVAVTVQCLTDPVYVAPAVLVPVAGVALLRIVRAGTRGTGLRLLLCVLLAAVVVAVLSAGHILLEHQQQVAGQSVWASHVPPPHLPAEFLRGLSPLAVPLAGWALALLAAAGLVAGRGFGVDPITRRALAHALWWVIAGLVISLPPVVKVFGEQVRVLPLWWLGQVLPLYSRLRVPIRLGVAALFGLSILAGLGFHLCTRRLAQTRLRASGLAALVALAMLVEYRAGLPSLRQPLPAAYPLVAAIAPPTGPLSVLSQPGGPLLELPLSQILTFPTPHARAMYRSIFHGHRLLNGYTSYYPRAFPARMALAARLPDPDALTALLRETGLELVLVHGDALAVDGRIAWELAAAGAGDPRLVLVARDGADMLFRVGGGGAGGPGRASLALSDTLG